ncbi:MAG: hypothetical protein NVSMB62_29880 [Acidobacteriaceae bacterium]
MQPTLNPGLPTSPTQPGLPTTNISPSPNGREHIFDTYAAWTAAPKLTLIGEADYVLTRTVSEHQPSRVVIGGFTAKYALQRNRDVGARAEYFDDRGGRHSFFDKETMLNCLTWELNLMPHLKHDRNEI